MELLTLLGKGSGGEVWEGIYEGRRVAIKKMMLSPKSNNEALIGSKIDCGHKNLLCLIAQTRIKQGNYNFHYLIYEYISDTVPLNKIIGENHIDTWTEMEILNCMYELCEGLEYLHNKNILHLDIKPGNIIVKERTPIIIDYDLACFSEDCEIILQPRGTPNYISPEMWRASEKWREVNEATDIYSLGVTFYQMLSGKNPYNEKNRELLRTRVTSSVIVPMFEQRLFQISSLIHEELSEMIIRMLEKDPEYRLSLEEVKKVLLRLIKS